MREMCVLVNREHGISWVRAKQAALRRKTGWVRIRKCVRVGRQVYLRTVVSCFIQAIYIVVPMLLCNRNATVATSVAGTT